MIFLPGADRTTLAGVGCLAARKSPSFMTSSGHRSVHYLYAHGVSMLLKRFHAIRDLAVYFMLVLYLEAVGQEITSRKSGSEHLTVRDTQLDNHGSAS